MNTNIRYFHDTAGQAHTLVFGPVGVMLDGRPCRLFVKDAHIDLLSLEADLGVVTVAPAEFWHALAGDDPTAEDAGLMQAQVLASFAALQEISRLTGQVRLLLDEIDRQVSQHSQPPLPSYRLPPFVRQLLALLDGSEEQMLAVARILKQPPQVICEWRAQSGKAVSLPLVDRENQPSSLPDAQQTDEQPAVSASSDVPEEEGEPTGSRRGKRGFLWTDEHERQLEAAYDASSLPSDNARIKDIAARYGWPFHVVDYRLRQLKKRRQAQQEAEEQPDAEENQVEEEAPAADPDIVAVVEQARPMSLPPGPFLWDVRINGNVQRWQLDFVYGQFPLKAGTQFVYRGREYVLLQVWNSMIEITAVEEAKAGVEERSPALPVLAVAAV